MLKYQIYGILLFIILLILIYLINKKTLNSLNIDDDGNNQLNIKEGFVVSTTRGLLQAPLEGLLPELPQAPAQAQAQAQVQTSAPAQALPQAQTSAQPPPQPLPQAPAQAQAPVQVSPQATSLTPRPTINPYLKYHKYDNAYFDLNIQEIPGKTIEQALSECSLSQTCLGITKDKLSNNVRKILKTDKCISQYQGSDIQKAKTFQYESYIKKTLNNYDQLCITNESMSNPFTIETSNDLILCIQNKSLVCMNKLMVKNNKLFELTQFMFVKGLYYDNEGTVSIKPVYEKYSDYYIVNDYPKKDYLFLKEITNNNVNDKKKASFRITNGLSGKGFSIKIVDFPNIYFRIEGASLSKDNIMVSSIDTSDENKVASTFYIKGANPETSLIETEQQQELKDDVRSLSTDEKVKLMKKTNINKLETQVSDLHNQSKKIDDMNYYHFNNINYIGREFANQAAELSLSKFLIEKEEIQKLALQTPSPDKMRITPTPTPTQRKSK